MTNERLFKIEYRKSPLEEWCRLGPGSLVESHASYWLDNIAPLMPAVQGKRWEFRIAPEDECYIPDFVAPWEGVEREHERLINSQP